MQAETTVPLPDFSDVLERMLTLERKRTRELTEFLKAKPTSITCAKHGTVRPLDLDRSRALSRERQELTAGYGLCAQCEHDRFLALQAEKLIASGVPENMTHCTLDNWEPPSAGEENVLVTVRAFALAKKGFLILTGNVGSGKSHLGVALMRGFKRPWFVKQSTLLLALRRTYHDRCASDPIALGQDADLLVLDEVGLTSGGRDELPMLHEILDYRYSSRKPTVITSNLPMDRIAEVLGPRLSDRMRECAFSILQFCGASHRSARRNDYFDAA